MQVAAEMSEVTWLSGWAWGERAFCSLAAQHLLLPSLLRQLMQVWTGEPVPHSLKVYGSPAEGEHNAYSYCKLMRTFAK